MNTIKFGFTIEIAGRYPLLFLVWKPRISQMRGFFISTTVNMCSERKVEMTEKPKLTEQEAEEIINHLLDHIQGCFVPNGLLRYKGISPGAKLVWVLIGPEIADDKDYTIKPTKLADKIGVSIDKVKQYLDELVNESLIKHSKEDKYESSM